MILKIKAAKEYVQDHKDVKIIHYEVNVTKDPQDYQKGRDNGEKLVHDYVNPDVTNSDAQCVIICHSLEFKANVFGGNIQFKLI